MRQGTHRYPPMERVLYGIPLTEALAQEVERIGASSVYVLASGTLARETDMIDRVRDVLGNRLAGVCAKIAAHTPRIDVVAAANAAREARADALLTVGGGSVTDAAKMVGLCLGNDVTDPAQLDALRNTIHPDGRTERPQVRPPAVRSIAVPTTLSAGEFTASAGCTDTLRAVKESYAHAEMMQRSVILDPAATLHTPEWLFLSTGIRAVDHAVEDICSINAQPLSDGTSIHALRLLAAGLRAVRSDPANLEARLDCQLGSWMSIMGSQNGGDERRQPRHRPCAGRHRRRAARLHLMRDAAARAALQCIGQRRSAGLGQRRDGTAWLERRRCGRRTGCRSRSAGHAARCRCGTGAARPDRGGIDARSLGAHQSAPDRRTGGCADAARRGVVISRR
ncbi:MAG: iron-containing alcohol dehydrogenase [Acetobacteraceae bacterium]